MSSPTHPAQEQSQPLDQAQSLSSINSSTLGTTMPEITLPNGVTVQTGTVGALLVSIKAYDELLLQIRSDSSPSTTTIISGDGASGNEERGIELETRMRASLSLLDKVEFSDLFAPDEWIGGGSGCGNVTEWGGSGTSPGRRFVGEAAKVYFAAKE